MISKNDIVLTKLGAGKVIYIDKEDGMNPYLIELEDSRLMWAGKAHITQVSTEAL